MAMTQEQKDAISKGLQEATAIKVYLKALDAGGSGRAERRNKLEKKLRTLDEKIRSSDDPLQRVELIQKRVEADRSLGSLGDEADFAQLEAGFVAHASAYSERKGISYTAWRQYGVPARVVKAAGIPETRRR